MNPSWADRIWGIIAVAVLAAACSGAAADPATTSTANPVATTTTVDPTSSTAAPSTVAPATAAPTTTTSEVPPTTFDPLTGSIEGVVVYTELSQDHVAGDVTYDPQPPVGGPHAAEWVSCGFYPEPVTEEGGVHSLEHGAVWVTFDAARLTEADVESLAGLATATFGDDERAAFVLVSPYPQMPSPLVASAWGRQLVLDSVDDPRLAAFLEYFANGPQNPEPGAPC